MSLNNFNQTLTVAGTIVLRRSKQAVVFDRGAQRDTFEAVVGRETYYQVLSNLDGLDRNRVPDPQGVARDDGVVFNLHKYAVPGRPVFVRGIYQENGNSQRYEARDVYLLHSDEAISVRGDALVADADHADGGPHPRPPVRCPAQLHHRRFLRVLSDQSEHPRSATDETVQECAVLSRLLYDLSSAYLMTGAERYLPRGACRGELLARGIPQPEPRRPLLLLGVRSQT